MTDYVHKPRFIELIRLTAKGARYLTISFYVALLFTVFALHKVSCYSFMQRTGRAMA